MAARHGRKYLVALVGVLAMLAAGEAAAQPDIVEGRCSNYRVSPTGTTVRAAGGSGTFHIEWDWEPPPSDGMCIINCSYDSCGDSTGSVRSSASWLRGTKRYSDRVDYTVQAHTGTSNRTGTLTVAGATFTVTQEGFEPCPSSPDSVVPSSVSFAAGGGTRNVTANGRSDCSWPVSDDRDWIAVTPSRVLGGDTVRISVGQNFGDAQSGTVTIGGRSVRVSQDDPPDCPGPGVSVTPTSVHFGSGAGSATVQATVVPVHIHTLVPCRPVSVPVSANRGWISVRPSAVRAPRLEPTRVTVTISVTTNTGTRSRSGTVTIGGRTVSVDQEGRSCPPSPDGVSPSSVSFGATGGNRRVSVSGRSDCSWSVGDNRTWISTPSRVSGGSSVSISVRPNTGGPRSGTVTIGGRSVDVRQDEGCPGSPTGVSPSSVSFGASGGSQSISVSGRSNCSWSVSGNQTWITIPSRVSGGGSVSISATANSGVARSGTVTIGSRTIRVDQGGESDCPRLPDVSPSSVSITNAGGSADVNVQETAACHYAVRDNQDWITVSPASVAGNGTVTIEVTSNSGGGRTGTVTIGSRAISVTQGNPDQECPTQPKNVSSPSPIQIPDTGRTVIISVPDESTCQWSVSDDRDWITPNRSVVTGREKIAVAVTWNKGGSRSGTLTIGSWSVRVVQGALTNLTANRDRLLEDWAPRKYGNDVCEAWLRLNWSAQEVFIWNTHRLSEFGVGDSKTMLDHVNKVYSITGKENPNDPRSCGGPRANRTFMSMSEDLNRKLVAAARGFGNEMPGWRESHDFSCIVDVGSLLRKVFRIGECPHGPFWFQSETMRDSPTGQIQLFAGGYVVVERDHYAGTTEDLNYVRNCGKFEVLVPRDEVCDGTCVAAQLVRVPQMSTTGTSWLATLQVINMP